MHGNALKHEQIFQAHASVTMSSDSAVRIRPSGVLNEVDTEFIGTTEQVVRAAAEVLGKHRDLSRVEFDLSEVRKPWTDLFVELATLNARLGRDTALAITGLGAHGKALAEKLGFGLKAPAIELSEASCPPPQNSPGCEALSAALTRELGAALHVMRNPVFSSIPITAEVPRIPDGELALAYRSDGSVLIQVQQTYRLDEEAKFTRDVIEHLDSSAMSARRVLFDCSWLEMGMGADALGAIASASARLKNRGGSIVLANVPPKLAEQLRNTRFDKVLPVANVLAE